MKNTLENNEWKIRWNNADGESDGLVNGYDKKTDSLNLNMYATGKFDDVIQYQQPDWIWKKKGYLNAEGEEETENEDSTEYEGEASEFQEESFEQEELPKFRQLVRNKKLEMKAQYGKAHFGTRRECKMVPYPTTCYKRVKVRRKYVDVPYPCTKNKEVCINVPTWIWGWRKKWREFKQSGGLAQLKMQSKGMAPIPGYNSPPSTNTPRGMTQLVSDNLSPVFNPPSNTNTPRGMTQLVSDNLSPVFNPPSNTNTPNADTQLDTGNGEVSQAGVAGNIIGTILIIGLVFGAIKMMK